MRIYKIEFEQYSDYVRHRVSDGNLEIGAATYIKTTGNPFLITEDQIDVVRKYGKGIKSLVCVGDLWDGKIV